VRKSHGLVYIVLFVVEKKRRRIQRILLLVEIQNYLVGNANWAAKLDRKA